MEEKGGFGYFLLGLGIGVAAGMLCLLARETKPDSCWQIRPERVQTI